MDQNIQGDQLQKHIKHHKAKLALAKSEKPGPVPAKQRNS